MFGMPYTPGALQCCHHKSAVAHFVTKPECILDSLGPSWGRLPLHDTLHQVTGHILMTLHAALIQSAARSYTAFL